MREKATWHRRLLRAAVFSLVLTGTAVCAHVLTGGMVPSARTVAGSAATMAAAGWWLAACRRHALTLLVVAVVGQLGLHSVFALSMAGAGRAHVLSLVVCGHASGSMAGQMTMPGPASSWSAGWMTAAHCVAAAVALLSVRHVEDLALYVAGFLRWSWRAVLVLGHVASRPTRSPIRVRPFALLPARQLVLAHAVVRRGPPRPLLTY